MKVLFTADWHIKLGQKSVPIDWQINRYRMLFRKLDQLQDKCDIIIIGGDIFDKMPNLEELKLFFEFLPIPRKHTLIYDGNHEATKRGQTFLTKLAEVAYNINTQVYILDGTSTYEGIDIIPYTDIKGKLTPSNNILCTHVRGDIPPHVKAEIDLDQLEQWDVVLAGDLHSYENSQRNILYPGSPVSTSFHRNPITNGVILFDTNTYEHEFIKLGLPQLIRKTISNPEEMVKTEYDHTIYEIEGDIKELANVDKDNELLDKKITNKSVESTLNFKNTTSIRDEVIMYLNDHLGLKEDDITSIMDIFDDKTTSVDLE